MLRADAALQA